MKQKYKSQYLDVSTISPNGKQHKPLWWMVIEQARKDANRGCLDAMIWLISIADIYLTVDEYEMVYQSVKDAYRRNKARRTLKFSPEYREFIGINYYKFEHPKCQLAKWQHQQIVEFMIERG